MFRPETDRHPATHSVVPPAGVTCTRNWKVRSGFLGKTVVCWAMLSSACGLLLEQALLADLDDHELGRLERRERHLGRHDPLIDELLRVGRAVADDLEGLVGGRPLERALPEQAEHEGLDVD